MSEEIIEPVAVEPTVEAPVEIPVEVVVPEPTPEPEPVAVAVEEPIVEEVVTAVHAVEVEPEPKPQPAPKKPRNPAVVVSGGSVDQVYLTKCVYKNKFERKSLTVHHLQRRLVELGFKEAGSDADGYYGDLTKSAVMKYQAANGIPSSGLMDVDTFINIFNGDPNVDAIV